MLLSSKIGKIDILDTLITCEYLIFILIRLLIFEKKKCDAVNNTTISRYF